LRTPLRAFKLQGTANSAAVPAGNMLFVTTGNTQDGSGGGVHAFALLVPIKQAWAQFGSPARHRGPARAG